jgi:RIO kinase 1
MRVPESLEPLVEQGVIDEVVRPLMSGKEAQVFLVRAGGELRVAKIYKQAEHRSFKHRAAYTEGRKVRNSRTQRAMQSRTRFGREMEEEAWKSAEVEAIDRLRAAGVRVPAPFAFVDGVLVMELIRGADGGPAPRLVDLSFEPDEARALFLELLREVQKMLCAGVVHGDLSDFNVLVDPDGPVIIDLPQWVDAAANAQAGRLLVRDVDNLTSFLSRFDPTLAKSRYGREMWQIYERGDLTPTTRLTGRPRKADHQADLSALLAEIAASEREAAARREALGLPPPRRARAPRVDDAPPPKPVEPKAKKPVAKPAVAQPHAPAPRDPAADPREPARAPARSAPPPPELHAEGLGAPGRKRKRRKRGQGAPLEPDARTEPHSSSLRDPSDVDDLDRFLTEEG